MGAFAQTTSLQLFKVVDQMPYFLGCEDLPEGSEEKRRCSDRNLILYISDYLNYPEKAKALGLEGTVYIEFIVTETGDVLSPVVMRDIGGDCGEVALKIVKDMPKWEPGIKKGKPVKVLLTLPIRFALKNAQKVNTTQLAWGGLFGKTVTKKKLKNNLNQQITVRDEKGDNLNIVELIFAYKKGDKIKQANSRTGEITAEMKRLINKMKATKGEFAIIATVQKNGEFVEVPRFFEIVKE